MVLLSCFPCVLGLLHRTAETFFPTAEFVLGEAAHRGIGAAKCVHLAQEVGEAGRVRLAHLLKRLHVKSCCSEDLACLFD